MKMIGPTIVFIIVMLCSSCSYSQPLAPANPDNLPAFKEGQRLDYLWDYGLFRVSADHKSIERIPYRAGEHHFNVTKFVEPPDCGQCLTIGKVHEQPDGTIKVNVTLRHPFPNQPEYTGFDVRGTVIFPATRYWEADPTVAGWYNVDLELMFEWETLMYFSLARDGGAELLNADGHTLYFFPGFHMPGFDQPIFKYRKGIHANGPDPDSTINGYKLFTNDPVRRMFKVTDTITRTYHISPPEGEFVFGYVVDASWAWPDNFPVTDPMSDFSNWANAEDGYILETENLNPFKLGTYGPTGYPYPPPITERMIVSTVSQVYYTGDDEWPGILESIVFCPDLTSNPVLQRQGVAFSSWHETIDVDKKIFESFAVIREGTYDGEPGVYPAIVCIRLGDGYNLNELWRLMARVPCFYKIIDLEVVEGN